jgi:hypothetical protein
VAKAKAEAVAKAKAEAVAKADATKAFLASHGGLETLPTLQTSLAKYS